MKPFSFITLESMELIIKGVGGNSPQTLEDNRCPPPTDVLTVLHCWMSYCRISQLNFAGPPLFFCPIWCNRSVWKYHEWPIVKQHQYRDFACEL
jgi:hypothetical protein